MFDGFYQLPIQMLAALAAIVFVGSYWIGCLLFRPLLRPFVRAGSDENDIVGSLLSAFGVLYGLLLSLIAVAAYQNLTKVDAVAGAEASTLLAFYRDASEFSSPQNEQLQSQLVDYCRYIIDEEWPLQRQGEVPRSADAKIAAIRKELLDFEPTGERDRLLQDRALNHFDTLTEYGRQRRYAAKASIPALMWYVVIVGTIINFTLLWLFDMKFVTQLFLGGLTAFFLGALILLIAVLERPYRSAEFGVSPDAYELVYQEMTEGQAEISGPVSSEGD